MNTKLSKLRDLLIFSFVTSIQYKHALNCRVVPISKKKINYIEASYFIIRACCHKLRVPPKQPIWYIDNFKTLRY